MRYKLLQILLMIDVILISVLLTGSRAIEQNSTVEEFGANGYKVVLAKILTRECDGVENKVSLEYEGKLIHEGTFCTVEMEDGVFVQKGYLTVIEHYSSPVGWSQYYVFDLCAGKLIKTKRMEEGTQMNWEIFVNLNEATMSKYVEKATNF